MTCHDMMGACILRALEMIYPVSSWGAGLIYRPGDDGGAEACRTDTTPGTSREPEGPSQDAEPRRRAKTSLLAQSPAGGRADRQGGQGGPRGPAGDMT